MVLQTIETIQYIGMSHIISTIRFFKTFTVEVGLIVEYHALQYFWNISSRNILIVLPQILFGKLNGDNPHQDKICNDDYF